MKKYSHIESRRSRYELWINSRLHAEDNNRNSESAYKCIKRLHEENLNAILNAEDFKIYKIVKSKFPPLEPKLLLVGDEQEIPIPGLRRKMNMWYQKKMKYSNAYEIFALEDYQYFLRTVRERTQQPGLSFKEAILAANNAELKYLLEAKEALSNRKKTA